VTITKEIRDDLDHVPDPSRDGNRILVRTRVSQNTEPTMVGGSHTAPIHTSGPDAHHSPGSDRHIPLPGTPSGDQPGAERRSVRFHIHAICQSPPFLPKPRHRQAYPVHLRNPASDSTDPPIPAGRSIHGPVPSSDLFPADRFHQSLASVCSFLSPRTTWPVVLLLRKIICPMPQSKSVARSTENSQGKPA